MAKCSVIARNKKRVAMCASFTAKRKSLKEIIYDKNLPLAQRYEAVKALNELPRNSSAVRIRNRCSITGRPRGVYRRFALCRNKIRELSGQCLLPGLVKSSW
ncbi:30S ribosomal protein S14 [Candidatus Sneabacter namystus]|uniref:Small ribosomal subunit protein uS14 n=1 Tax=Candidatus Sneabacter namystus TaxID=2601646 RepID=A0A5C0UJ09_9RICK|nr:30S ribosomal protein S14 [Candidatus Sneabacter namystus]QEK39779.1 30S ribosomal protein S14 [Candidatus Sneabacter namystus]